MSMSNKKFISFSGGVESTTMAILYGKGAKLIWVDTGGEHKELYERIDKVEEYLYKLHKGDIELIRLKGAYKVLGEIKTSLEDAIVAKKFFPSAMRRYCTAYFKIKPIDEFLQQQDECELMIGFNADEEGRTGNLEAMKNVAYTYPLIEGGLDRNDCEEILKLHGLHPNFPIYMNRGGCKFCFFKSEKEYKAMYHLDRETFEEVAELERKLQDKRDKHYAIQSNGKPMHQIAAEAQSEINFDWNEIYKEQKRKIYCGAFCHR
jgi:3'-phosphoadenosine 5'-phosphosulfate sulfotransferase (PAPS reductase)/FAD synthetase